MHLSADSHSYRVVRWLGEGQTSVVCLAERIDSRGLTSHSVALKILKSETRIQWLKREFDALKSIDSPHCVRVLGFEHLPGEGHALVMEAIDGETLETIARSKALSVDEADEVARQIQVGLYAMRKQDLAHGDLAPRNVLVDRSGRVRLVDFGAPPAECGHAATPAYVAPEIWSGARPSFESDLFSLGLLWRDLQDRFVDADGIGSDADALTRSLRVARASARDRCASFSWLALCAGERLPREIVESSAAQKALASRVGALLEARAERDALRTQPLEPARAAVRRCRIRPASKLALSACFVLAFVGPTPTNRSSASPHKRGAFATFEARSHAWRDIWLDGQHIGFTPTRAVHLEPGRHRTHWTGAAGAGETTFDVAPGETATLREGRVEIRRRISRPHSVRQIDN